MDTSVLLEYRNAYFIYLTRYLKIINEDGFDFDDILPYEIKQRTENYLNNCDNISSWFFEHYEKTDDDTEILQVKNLYDEFKDSELFLNMSKKEKRLYNKTYFNDKVRSNISLRKYFKVEEQRKKVLEKYGFSSKIRNVLVGFQTKPDEK